MNAPLMTRPLSRVAERIPARGRRGDRRPGPGPGRGGHRQDPGADHAPRPYPDDRQGAAAASCSAVTFTNKAAREMKDRISALIGRPVEGWWLGTFHALAARLLRRHAEVVGPQAQFHHPRYRRSAPPAEAAHRRRGSGRQEMAGARPAGGHRALEGPRPHPGQGDLGGAGGLCRRASRSGSTATIRSAWAI